MLLATAKQCDSCAHPQLHTAAGSLNIESTECARGRLDVQHINIKLNSK